MADLCNTARPHDWLKVVCHCACSSSEGQSIITAVWRSNLFLRVSSQSAPLPVLLCRTTLQLVKSIIRRRSYQPTCSNYIWKNTVQAGLGAVPRTSVATLIIPAPLLFEWQRCSIRLMPWLVEDVAFPAVCCYAFIGRDSRAVLSLSTPAPLLMDCRELWFSLSSTCWFLSGDNRRDLAK